MVKTRMPVAWDATKASYLVPQLFSIQNVHHIGLLLITEGMHNGSKIVNGDRSLYLCSIKAHKSFFSGLIFARSNVSTKHTIVYIAGWCKNAILAVPETVRNLFLPVQFKPV